MIIIRFLYCQIKQKIKSFMKGYHAYKDLLKPIINEPLTTDMEPDNIADMYAILKKKTSV